MLTAICAAFMVFDWPRLCENARAPFSGVKVSHVNAVSGDLRLSIRLLAILRGERNEFSHGLGQERSPSLNPSICDMDSPCSYGIGCARLKTVDRSITEQGESR